MPKISQLPLATTSDNTDEFVFVQSGITKRATKSLLLGALQTDVSALQTDVSALQTDVSALQTDVSALQTTVGNLPTNTILTDGSVDMDLGYTPLNALSIITKDYFDTNIPTIDITTVYSNTETTFTVPVRTSISSEDNAIDFSKNNNFELTATAANITAIGMVAGQSGTIIMHTAENVTGWDANFKFKTVPVDLSGDEIFGYFIDDLLNVWIGRVQ